MLFVDFVEERVLEAYAGNVVARLPVEPEIANGVLNTWLLDKLSVPSELRPRITFESKIISEVESLVENYEAFSARGDDYSNFTVEIADLFNRHSDEFFDLIRQQALDHFGTDYDQDWYDDLDSYLYSSISEDDGDFIPKIDLPEGVWQRLFNDDSAHDHIQDTVDRNFDHSYEVETLWEEVCQKLDLDTSIFDEYDFCVAFENLYLNDESLEGLNTLKISVKFISYVYNAEENTPEMALEQSQELLSFSRKISEVFPMIDVDPIWIDNPKVYYVSSPLFYSLDAIVRAKELGMRIGILCFPGDVELSENLASYTDVVYLCTQSILNDDAYNINFPLFTNEFFVINTLMTFQWLAAARFRPSPMNFRGTSLNVSSFRSGSGASMIVELPNREDEVLDLRINSSTSLNIDFKNTEKRPFYRTPSNLSFDVNGNVNFNVDAFDPKLRLFHDIYAGLKIKEFQELLNRRQPSRFSGINLRGVFMSEFEDSVSSALIFLDSFNTYIYSNSHRASVKCTLLDSNVFSGYSTDYQTFKGGYNLDFLGTERARRMPRATRLSMGRGKFYLGLIFLAEDAKDLQGSVLYRCFIQDTEDFNDTILVESINDDFDIVLA